MDLSVPKEVTQAEVSCLIEELQQQKKLELDQYLELSNHRLQILKAWCKALRSGRFRQIQGALHDNLDGFCAVGVLMYQLGTRNQHMLEAVLSYADLQNVIAQNDIGFRSFETIARWVEDTIINELSEANHGT